MFSTDSIIIIIFSIFAFIIAYFFARSNPSSNFWNYIDIIYYPLVAIGVTILFLESKPLRDIDRAKIDLKSVQEKKSKLDSKFSNIDTKAFEPSVIHEGAKELEKISSLAKQCAGSSEEKYCSTSQTLNMIISNGISLLSKYEEPADLFEICNEAEVIFSAIVDTDGFSKPIMSAVSLRYFEGLRKNYFQSEVKQVRRYIDESRPFIEKEAVNVRKNLFSSMEDWKALSASEGDKQRVIDLHEIQIEFGISLLYAFESCIRAPTQVRDEDFAAADSELKNSAKKETAIGARLKESLREKDRFSTFAQFRHWVWPFLLILALSMKFAKGIAALSAQRAQRESEPNALTSKT